MKKKLIYLLIGSGILIVMPILINFIVFNNDFPSRVSNDGWSGFLGGYIGAIIGAIATIVAVNMEIRHNESIRREDLQRELRPYLYFQLLEYNTDGTCDVNLSNFGKYAACDLKGYMVVDNEKKMVWNQHFSLNGGESYKIFIGELRKETDYYIYEFKDIAGNLYEQIVKANQGSLSSGKYYMGDLYSIEPKIVQNYSNEMNK